MKKRALIAAAIAVVLVAVLLLRQFVFHKSFRYAGTIEATKVDVSSRLNSTIKSIAVQEGDSVAKDAPLAELSCDDIRILAAQAARDLARATRLVKRGSVSEDTFEHSRTQNDDAQLRLSWCDIKAPLSGVVLTRYHEPGEVAAPGMKLFTIADLHDVWAYIYIAEPLLDRVHLGMKVKGYLDQNGNRALDGTVVKINDEAEFTPKNVQTQAERTRLVYGIKIDFTNPDGLLKPGMPIEVALPEQP
ncbi:MAG: efflux RND transporter periplasmic adaptor subunit [Acidiferrobacterales bacterium]